MKKFLIATVSLMLLLILSYIILLASTELMIPFFEHISFGSSENEVIDEFGQPLSVDPNKYDMDLTFYDYERSVLNEPAYVELGFSERGLERALIEWTCSSAEDASEMFCRLKEELKAALGWRIDFKVFEPEVSSSVFGKELRQKFYLGNPNSSNVVRYVIAQNGTRVFVKCLNFG